MSRPTRARLRSSINPHPRVHRHVGPALVLTLAWLALPADTAASTPQMRAMRTATASVETKPVEHAGDAADDPAIWYDPSDPSGSLVIGNDKQGALEVYDLRGNRVQRITGGFFGNVDTRRNVRTGAGRLDLVVTWHDGITVYAVDAASHRLTNVTDTRSGSIRVPTGGEGLCLYQPARSSRLFAFVISRQGYVAQYELLDQDGDGRLEGALRRGWEVGSESEGCVADDELGHLYVSEESVGIWKYGAAPWAPSGRAARTLVDGVRAADGRIRPDVEGLTIVYGAGAGGYLIASSQAASDTLNSYLVYERSGGNAFVREVRVVDGDEADGCARTDGIDALAADLGRGFRHGMFVCQDNRNTAPGPGRQNFKFVPLERIVEL